jgi:hypothetical protein
MFSYVNFSSSFYEHLTPLFITEMEYISTLIYFIVLIWLWYSHILNTNSFHYIKQVIPTLLGHLCNWILAFAFSVWISSHWLGSLLSGTPHDKNRSSCVYIKKNKTRDNIKKLRLNVTDLDDKHSEAVCVKYCLEYKYIFKNKLPVATAIYLVVPAASTTHKTNYTIARLSAMLLKHYLFHLAVWKQTKIFSLILYHY